MRAVCETSALTETARGKRGRVAWRLGLNRLRVQGFPLKTGASTPQDGVRAVDTFCCLRGPAQSLITSGAWVRCERLDAQVRHQPSRGADTRRPSSAIIAVIR